MDSSDLSSAEYEEIDVVPMHDSIVHIDGFDCPCSPLWCPKNKWDLKEGKANKILLVHNRILDQVLQ